VIEDFEQRLAEVLGERLPAPFQGRVGVPPAPGPDAEPAIVVGVTRAVRAPDGVGGARPMVAPGAPDPRRVVRLRCTVELNVIPASDEGRAQQLDGLDAALYALDDPAFRGGAALVGGDPDPGFLIHELELVEGLAPLAPGDPAGPVAVRLEADGVFWPRGVAGQAGERIGEVRVRGTTLPLEVVLPATPSLVAGGPAVTVAVRVGASGTLVLAAGEDPAALPFGRLALLLRGRGGRPAAGTLQGGDAGSGGARLVALEDGAAAVDYVPPAEPARDELVVALEDGEGGAGVELGRRALAVGPA
jgi:hypothetical protein